MPDKKASIKPTTNRPINWRHKLQWKALNTSLCTCSPDAFLSPRGSILNLSLVHKRLWQLSAHLQLQKENSPLLSPKLTFCFPDKTDHICLFLSNKAVNLNLEITSTWTRQVLLFPKRSTEEESFSAKVQINAWWMQKIWQLEATRCMSSPL